MMIYFPSSTFQKQPKSHSGGGGHLSLGNRRRSAAWTLNVLQIVVDDHEVLRFRRASAVAIWFFVPTAVVDVPKRGLNSDYRSAPFSPRHHLGRNHRMDISNLIVQALIGPINAVHANATLLAERYPHFSLSLEHWPRSQDISQLPWNESQNIL
ncbi:hypothetical protein SISNIDRAFT_249033 [Sistotremastrum niveocremeum HHB9708]|uniref:Uncharacterized protein n=1 Tax=Sistotremastrum niveocremeum HHB9708 TaxID=1314777 RepID=A0A164YVK4_9AGAM|nr:hypothetical protein SISNIDRAFT_249033 [Sistotremastrum niveocremeum HHB9708]